MIPRFKPRIDKDEVLALLRPGKNAVRRFEKEFAKSFGAADAVAFPYGRSALWAFLKAVGVCGADVVTPSYTCSVVAHAVSLSCNNPKFVDIQLNDYNMDLVGLSDAIDENTRAVIATHIFGYPFDLESLESIVKTAESKYGHKIWIIQDCAHSFAATWKGRQVTTSGDVALYGLNISKMITSIFGGMLTFTDKELAARIREWRDAHFREPGRLKPLLRRLYLLAALTAFNEVIYGFTWWLQNKTPFLNRLTKAYHLDDKIHFPPDYLDQMLDVEANVGIVQLQKYDRIIQRRRENAAWYDMNLPDRNDWTLPPIVQGATYSHYVIRTQNRESILRTCAKQKIELGQLIDYNVADLKSYSGIAHCPNSRAASETVINLPVDVTATTRERILDAIRNCP